MLLLVGDKPNHHLLDDKHLRLPKGVGMVEDVVVFAYLENNPLTKTIDGYGFSYAKLQSVHPLDDALQEKWTIQLRPFIIDRKLPTSVLETIQFQQGTYMVKELTDMERDLEHVLMQNAALEAEVAYAILSPSTPIRSFVLDDFRITEDMSDKSFLRSLQWIIEGERQC